MTPDEIDTLAHHMAYLFAGQALTGYTRSVHAAIPGGKAVDWHDLSTFINEQATREDVASAIFYLDARQLLLRFPGQPHLARVAPSPSASTPLTGVQLEPISKKAVTA